MPAMTLLLSPDLVEFEERSFKFVVEEPHRIEDFAESCRRLGSVGASEREGGVVSQISQDPRLRNSVVGEAARLESGSGRSRDDLNEFKELHLIDRILQRSHDRRDLQEKISVCVCKTISHRDPVIEPTIQIADPRLFPFVASDQSGRFYRLLDCGPFRWTDSGFRWTGLQASLVRIGARIPDILLAVGLGKEQPQADAACH